MVTQAVCAAGIQGPGHGGRREAFQPGGCCEESGSVTVWGARGGAARDTRLPYGGRLVRRGKGDRRPESPELRGGWPSAGRRQRPGLQGQHWSAVGETDDMCFLVTVNRLWFGSRLCACGRTSKLPEMSLVSVPTISALEGTKGPSGFGSSRCLACLRACLVSVQPFAIPCSPL